MKKAIIFDMDGVLIDSEPLYRKRREDFFKQHDIVLSEDQQQEFIGSNPDDMFRFLFPNNLSKQNIFKRDYLNYKHNQVVAYTEIINPDLVRTLGQLKQHHVKLAIASSGSLDSIKAFLKANHLLNNFDVIVSGTQFERSKPHPAIYLETLSQLKLSASECLAVEDSTHGIQAAKSAGIEVLGLKDARYPIDQSQATATITSLLDILDWL